MENTLINNRYYILKALGAGGCGQTFLAIDRDIRMSSAQKCVVKRLKPVTHLQKQEWMKWQFKQEAAVLARLGAENNQIPQLYAYFSEGNTFYLIQEWIEGTTLTQKQQLQGILSEAEVRKILVSLLPVLDYIHSNQVIHQDIKPDNIILRAADELPVLIDFGAAMEATTRENNQHHDVVVMGNGTPGYMPPEQMSGHPVFTSDLYSLGLTAIYLLTGKTPQDLETNWDTGTIIWHQEAGHLSINLITVIDKAIRFNISDRFTSAAEMLIALESQAITLTSAPQLSSKDIDDIHHFSKNITLKIMSLFLLASTGIGLILANIQSISLESVSKLSSPKNFSVESPKTLVSSSSVPLESSSLESFSVTATVTEDKSKNPNDITIFVPGTLEKEILTAMGEPTWRRKGYWTNSMAWLYKDILSNQADIGYLFDTKTKRLRQTEISFAPSVNLETMQNALNNMLSGNSSFLAREGLEQIYHRHINVQKFRVVNLEGIIQRNDKDRIYIGIWETSFH